MKKIIFTLICIFAATFGYPNNIKMVSYFPIPYASYFDLKVSNTCDVGLMDDCELKTDSLLVAATSEATPNPALNTGTLFVKSGTFNVSVPLNTSSSLIKGNMLRVGVLTDAGALESSSSYLLSGGNLVVRSKFLNGTTINSLASANRTTIKNLSLKGYEDAKLNFPTCGSTNHEINWANLTINGAQGIYLVCGEGICEEKYGNKVTLGSTLNRKDTCDGNINSQFSCSGENMSCNDVWKVEVPVTQSNTTTMGTYSTVDTCDGDRLHEFQGTITKDCTDVYIDWRGSDLGVNYHNCNATASDLAIGKDYCSGDPFAFYEIYQGLGRDGESFCEQIVVMGHEDGCFAEFQVNPDTNYGCNRPSEGSNYIYGVNCYPIYRVKQLKGPDITYYYRPVRCCGD